MRIALVAHHGSPLTPATGQEPMSQAASVAAHAQALAKLGHRVTIYARRDSRGLPGSAILAPAGDRRARARGPAGSARAVRAGRHRGRVRRPSRAALAAGTTPDVVHAYFWTSGLAALAATRGLDIPLVQTFGTLGVAERGTATRPPTAMTGASGWRPASRAAPDAVLAGTAAEAAELVSMGVPRTVGHRRAVRGGHR